MRNSLSVRVALLFACACAVAGLTVGAPMSALALPSWEFRATWPPLETTPVFHQPMDVCAAADGTTYILCEGYVVRIDGVTQHVTVWAIPGGTPGGGSWLSGQAMAVAADGNLYISDTHNNAVLKVSGSGALLGTIGTSGAGAQQYTMPGALAVGPTGDLYVVDGGNSRIQRYHANGTWVSSTAISSPVMDIAVDQASSLYVLRGYDDGQLIVKYPDGAGPPQTLETYDQTLDDHVNIWSMTAGDGVLYVEMWTMDASTHDWVQRYDSSTGAALPTPLGSTYDTGYIPHVNMGRDGHLYAAGLDEDVLEFSGTTLVQRWATRSSELGRYNDPSDTAVGANGAIYVLDQGNNRVQQMTSKGVFVRAWGSYGSAHGQFSSPQGITVAPDGTVYVADTGNSRIQRFSSTGAYLMSWGTPGTTAGKFNSPVRVVVTAAKYAYVLDADVRYGSDPDDDIYTRRVQRFKVGTTTVSSATWKKTGWFDSSEDYLAVAPGGNVYFSNNRWSSTGTHLKKLHIAYGTSDIAIASGGAIYTVRGGSDCYVRKYTSAGNLAWKHGKWGVGANRFIYPSGLSVSGGGRLYVADTWNHRVEVFGVKLE